MVTSNTKGYCRSVEKSHRKFTSAIKKSRSRQGLMNLYWRHKREHEAILRRHLREEMMQLNQLKKKIK
ncbi:MAG: hypothetical protein WD531_03060 [Nitrosopumilaceae archaeon]